MNPHTLKWIPCWELESQWIPKSSKRDCRGENPSFWKVIYIIGKLLKLECLKWAHIAHLHLWNTSYDQKKGQESNWQFDSRPLKVGNQPNFLAWRRHVTYRWKSLNEGYNFALDLITGVPTMRILGLPFGNIGTKNHLDVTLVESYIIYYKREGGGFPQVRAMVSCVCPSCPWLVLAPKVFQLCTNHPVLVLRRLCE
jgi:hypothetical protein